MFTEALAAMGNVHPFFERAGMTAYRRQKHPHDERFISVLETVGIRPVDLAVPEKFSQQIEETSAHNQAWVLEELQRWYKRGVRETENRVVTVSDQLQAAQRQLHCQPVYYLKDNRN